MKTNKTIAFILLLIIGLSIILPFVWVFLISLKTRVDALAMPPNWIFKPTIANYRLIFEGDSVRSIFNSFIIATSSSFIIICLSIPAAYTFSRISLRKLKNSFFFFMTMRMVPAAVISLPIFFIFSKIRLIDNYIGIILMNVAINMPVAIWLLKILFDRTPKSIDEAAIIDGTNFKQLLLRHIIPIHKKEISVILILSFIMSWSEFFLGMILTGFDKRPLTVEISSFITPHGTNWGQLSALTVISFIPITLLLAFLYLIFNKELVRNGK